MRNDDLLKLRELDFNLLKTLLVLLEQKHVSNSADILCITQPAVSKQLAKLREVFDDPLLVRVGNQQVLTQKSMRIYPKVAKLCEQVRELVSPETLVLEDVRQNVTIMFSDYASPRWMTLVVEKVHQLAPQVTITCKNWSEENVDKLVKGEINFALGPIPNSVSNFESTKLGEVTSSLIVRNNHPLLASDTNIESKLGDYPILRIKGSDHYQDVYGDLVGRSQILLDEVSLWLALETLKHTDAVVIGPSNFIANIDENNHLASIPLPTVNPISILICWTNGLTNDLFYHWFSDLLIEAGSSILNESDLNQ